MTSELIANHCSKKGFSLENLKQRDQIWILCLLSVGIARPLSLLSLPTLTYFASVDHCQVQPGTSNLTCKQINLYFSLQKELERSCCKTLRLDFLFALVPKFNCGGYEGYKKYSNTMRGLTNLITQSFSDFSWLHSLDLGDNEIEGDGKRVEGWTLVVVKPRWVFDWWQYLYMVTTNVLINAQQEIHSQLSTKNNWIAITLSGILIVRYITPLYSVIF